jgi:hypothetical protein
MEGEIKNLFVLAAIDKASQLKKTGRNFSIERFAANGKKFTLAINGKEKKTFNLLVKGDQAFCLEENPEEKKPMDEMVIKLFVLANGGQEIPGLLESPSREEYIFEEAFPYASPIIPT